jgi:hypothetical protein
MRAMTDPIKGAPGPRAIGQRLRDSYLQFAVKLTEEELDDL